MKPLIYNFKYFNNFSAPRTTSPITPWVSGVSGNSILDDVISDDEYDGVSDEDDCVSDEDDSVSYDEDEGVSEIGRAHV